MEQRLGARPGSAWPPPPAVLAAWRSRRAILLGVGNPDRADDAFGVLVASRLAAAGRAAFAGGPAPENFTGVVARARPETIILADAAPFGAAPGALALMDPAADAAGRLATHGPGLGLLARFLAERTGAAVALIACQPGDLTPFASPTPAVAAAVESACQLLQDVIAPA